MAKIDGVNVCGYHHYGNVEGLAGMQTCGQVEIGGFSTYNGKDPALFLAELAKVSYEPALNVVFSITGTHFIENQTYTTPNRLIQFLLDSPNTRVMHWYKNDAHGPNWIFLCIYHQNIPSKAHCSPGYTVEEIRKRITYKTGVYGMKESE